MNNDKALAHPGAPEGPSVDGSPAIAAPPSWSAEQLEKMRKFAAGRVTAEQFADPSADLAPVWAPKVAGMYVRVDGQHYGYQLRALALEAGRRYRQQCRDELALVGDGEAAKREPSSTKNGAATHSESNLEDAGS